MVLFAGRRTRRTELSGRNSPSLMKTVTGMVFVWAEVMYPVKERFIVMTRRRIARRVMAAIPFRGFCSGIRCFIRFSLIFAVFAFFPR